MTESVIWTDGLTKRFDETLALDGIDLDVRPGEVFGLIGPDGAGKTTTLRLLLDLIRPSAGHLKVLGHDPRSGGTALRHRIGYLPGELPNLGRQRVAELLTSTANLTGGVAPSTIRTLADRLQLDLKRSVGSLPRGERQKVALVRALMHEPDLLLMDEPANGLAPWLLHEFRALVHEARANGRTVFFTSRVLTDIVDVVDRIAIIRAGRLVAVEDPAAFRRCAQRHVKIEFATAVQAAAFSDLPNVCDVRVTGNTMSCHVDGDLDALVKAAARYPVANLTSTEPNIDDADYSLNVKKEGPHRAA